MTAILGWSLKVYHTIKTSIGCAVALVSMLIKFFLGEHIPTSLFKDCQICQGKCDDLLVFQGRCKHTSQLKETILSFFPYVADGLWMLMMIRSFRIKPQRLMKLEMSSG